MLTFDSYQVYGTDYGIFYSLVSFIPFGLDRSKFIVGMNRVDFITGAGNPRAFIFGTRLFPDDNTLEYTLSGSFKTITFATVIFYQYGCLNSLYPFKIANASATIGFVCYDKCALG